MSAYGMICNHEWCSGCHSCEIACQMEHGFPAGQTGIEVVKIGPWPIGDNDKGAWQIDYLAVPTDQCDTCAARRASGKEPTCVKHCQAKCLSFGTIEELGKQMASKRKQTLYAL
ncbi:4Fe-4S dicluster domain-containing protein [Gordonibacter massiliensis (ex Traore et al. 2017)]|uniref:Oxidoreductase n=1 Tax=Gordonibacter massiliensis (ex Traore et al. 2017) TaxID=1841863 RepID=A0A842JBI4_9ACTN|nr:4Fe-4S dicluster domain-containing protein [Gordonibacter massiliensis (ex Traore et al. 2017)]MBC2888196.1 oxidoreductase [Gordonibacter massiliensis (ex Traore et al. 2017)]